MCALWGLARSLGCFNYQNFELNGWFQKLLVRSIRFICFLTRSSLDLDQFLGRISIMKRHHRIQVAAWDMQNADDRTNHPTTLAKLFDTEITCEWRPE